METPFFLLLGLAGIGLLLFWLLGYEKSSGDLSKEIEHTQSKSPRKIGIIASKYFVAQEEAASRYIQALAGRISSEWLLNTTPDHLARSEEVTNAGHKNFLIRSEEADKLKLTLPTYDALKLAEGTAQTEILKAKGLKDIEWEFLEKETNLQLKSAMVLAIKEHWEMKALTEMFEIVARSRYAIEIGNDPPSVKQILLERYDKNLKILDEAIDGRSRLLKEMDGQEPEGTQPNSEDRRDS